jgi:hypothetical protein
MIVHHDAHAGERPDRFDEIDRMLETRGHELGSTGLRVAAGRSGLAFASAKGPVLHLSWWVLSGAALAAVALRRLRVQRAPS